MDQIVLCVACFLAGNFASKSGIASRRDGEAVFRLAHNITLPALLLVSLSSWAVPGRTVGIIAAGSCISSLLTAACSWITFKDSSTAIRVVLTSCAASSMGAAVTLPFIYAALGTEGLRFAAVYHIGSWITGLCVVQSLLMAHPTRVPKEFVHSDGGVYVGQWLGRKKQGIGSYRYPGKAKYEGEWNENIKDGFGVYHFAKGGMYKGQWRSGSIAGVGVRVFSNGTVAAGRWQNGGLVETLPLRQCAATVEAASQAASAARQSQGESASYWQACLMQPAIWASVCGMALALTSASLPASVSALAVPLATVHTPLTLLALGLLSERALQQIRLPRQLLVALLARHSPALLIGTAAALAGGLQASVAVVASIMASLGPCELTVLQVEREVQLDEPLAESWLLFSQAASVLLLAVYGTAVVALPAASAVRQFIPAAIALAGVGVLLSGALLSAPQRKVSKMVLRTRMQSTSTTTDTENAPQRRREDGIPLSMSHVRVGVGSVPRRSGLGGAVSSVHSSIFRRRLLRPRVQIIAKCGLVRLCSRTL